jgi:hypothetical protein
MKLNIFFRNLYFHFAEPRRSAKRHLGTLVSKDELVSRLLRIFFKITILQKGNQAQKSNTHSMNRHFKYRRQCKTCMDINVNKISLGYQSRQLVKK